MSEGLRERFADFDKNFRETFHGKPITNSTISAMTSHMRSFLLDAVDKGLLIPFESTDSIIDHIEINIEHDGYGCMKVSWLALDAIGERFIKDWQDKINAADTF